VVTADSVIFGLVFGQLFGAPGVAYVVSIDRFTGALRWATQVDAHPAAVITSSPLLENGKLYVGVSSGEESFSLIPHYPCCSFRGSVVSLDAETGKLLWEFTIGSAGADAESNPITYEVDGKQYVLAAAGTTFVAFALP
jgi:outer membrane protein assembly factor BamB